MRATVRRRLVLGIWATVAVVTFFACIRQAGDFRGYLEAGELALRGSDIYLSSTNTWPPLFSLFSAPLALLARPSVYLARGFWLILNMAAFLLVLRLAAGLVYGRRFTLSGGHGSLWLGSPELVWPVVLCALYLYNNFVHLQINILWMALTLAGLWLDARDRPWRGGALIGFAAALKLMPIAFIPYLLYRCRWKAGLSALLSTAAFSLAPALVFGWEKHVRFMHRWLDVLHAGWGVGKMNQSVYAMLDRYIGHAMTPLMTPGVDNVPASGEPAVHITLLALMALVALACAVLFRGRDVPDSWPRMIEWSIVFLVSVLFGTVCWKSYLIVTVLPTALLVDLWQKSRPGNRRRMWIASLLGGVFLLAGAASPDLLGRSAVGRLEMASNHTIAMLALLAGLFVWRLGLFRQQKRTGQEVSQRHEATGTRQIGNRQ